MGQEREICNALLHCTSKYCKNQILELPIKSDVFEKKRSFCSQSEWVDVLQEQQLLYNKLVNMSCVTSMGVYYRNITRADR